MFAKKCCRCTKPITGVYAVLSVTEICLLRNVVDLQSLLLGTYTVWTVTAICLLRNVVDVQSLLLVSMLCGVLQRYVC